ncbi:Hsp33 family molecular chaperone HslO [Megasphaera vaginalis (ex Srinivasan et al. 2021)]|uniref:33 kDa chaperonin n=1 Tax=Megasphaera vaginalis (ex Srinivasan et al. 2021) TaxID=1111454 RepID=U7ULT2_9FIRM|nr:Hsp33 family molecular chaperone HslO [Megasphaera vaginalis (ex Srinivasan et al. 2021)]ERT60236.1 chaperonin HslO [Megasphaera vaginalis (ex Srinivasan et al. 2021)]
MRYTDQIVHYTADENIRVAIALTREITETARLQHHLSPVACAALGRAMTGALLLAGDYKNHEGVSLRFDGKGPLGAIHVDSFRTNRVRGYVDHPTVDLPLKENGKLDVGRAVGTDGVLSVTRFTPEKTTYTSQSDLVSGEIAEDLAYYLYTSEQIPATINLGVLVDRDYTIAASGGFLVQALPGAADDDLARIEANLGRLAPITTYLREHENAEGLIETIFDGFHYKELYRQPLYWRCTCSLQRIENVLLSLRREDKEALLKDPQVEMTCHYCGSKYVISHDDLVTLFSENKG